MATDAPLALGVLALAAGTAPPGVRVLLLSVAIVDDVIAITLIAAVLTDELSLAWLIAGLAFSAVCWLTFRGRLDKPWLLGAIALVVWVCNPRERRARHRGRRASRPAHPGTPAGR